MPRRGASGRARRSPTCSAPPRRARRRAARRIVVVLASAERFLAAIREQRPHELRRLLRDDPSVARTSVFAAAGAGEAEDLAAELARNPALARARDAARWTPLLYAAASPLHRDGAARRA